MIRPGSMERRERALQQLFWIGAVAAGVAIVIGTFLATVPPPVSPVRGIATEASRDINKVPTAPVKYTHNGVERTELVPDVVVVAGEPVEFMVSASGLPEGRSWGAMVFFTFAALVVAAGGLLLVWLIAGEALEQRMRRAEWRDYRTGTQENEYSGGN